MKIVLFLIFLMNVSGFCRAEGLSDFEDLNLSQDAVQEQKKTSQNVISFPDIQSSRMEKVIRAVRNEKSLAKEIDILKLEVEKLELEQKRRDLKKLLSGNPQSPVGIIPSAARENTDEAATPTEDADTLAFVNTLKLNFLYVGVNDRKAILQSGGSLIQVYPGDYFSGVKIEGIDKDGVHLSFAKGGSKLLKVNSLNF